MVAGPVTGPATIAVSGAGDGARCRPERPAPSTTIGVLGPQRLGAFPINSTPLPFQWNRTSVCRPSMPPG